MPKDYWKHTPITLKATAGLRLLPKEQGDAILAVVRKVRNWIYAFRFQIISRLISDFGLHINITVEIF